VHRFVVALLLASAGALAEEPLRTDLHAHLSMREALKPFFHGESGNGPKARSPDAIFVNQLEAEELRNAGVRLIVASVWPPVPIRPGRTPRDEALHQLDALHAFVRRHAEFRLAGSAAEARAILARGQLALLPAVEGGEGISSVDDVDLYYARGARVLTVVHMADNGLAGAAEGQLGRILGLAPSGRDTQGLTPLGRQVLGRMMDLGMVIDVAHASDAAAGQVLDQVEARGVPVLYTHGGSREFVPMERNLSDALARRVVGGGGLVGITLYREFLQGVPPEKQWPGYARGTCDDVVAHWKHVANVVGPASVVLGSDFNGMVNRAQPGGSCPNGIRSSADLPDLFAALAAHGIPRLTLDQGGERLLHVLEQVEAHANPAAQKTALSRRAKTSGPFDVAL
jgi:membrane dipeptidase